MGFSISWIAIRGIPKAEVCARLALRDSQESDEANESPISGASLPTGWFLLFLNQVTHPFVKVDALRQLSKGCEVVGGQVEEHVMVSAAFCYQDGHRLWNITHESDKGKNNLEVDGSLPEQFEDIRAKCFSEQRRDDEEGDGDVDYIFEIPLEVAESVCGYKHDQWEFDWGQPAFTKFVHAAR
jgi:hypothetical protein